MHRRPINGRETKKVNLVTKTEQGKIQSQFLTTKPPLPDNINGTLGREKRIRPTPGRLHRAGGFNGMSDHLAGHPEDGGTVLPGTGRGNPTPARRIRKEKK